MARTVTPASKRLGPGLARTHTASVRVGSRRRAGVRAAGRPALRRRLLELRVGRRPRIFLASFTPPPLRRTAAAAASPCSLGRARQANLKSGATDPPPPSPHARTPPGPRGPETGECIGSPRRRTRGRFVRRRATQTRGLAQPASRISEPGGGWGGGLGACLAGARCPDVLSRRDS